MQTPGIFGVLLVVLGLAAFTYTTVKPADFGPAEVTAEKQHAIPHPPIIGAIALMGGVLLLLQNRKIAHPPRP